MPPGSPRWSSAICTNGTATCRPRGASASRSRTARSSACSGPNGSGKTTTLECVIGLREPDAGDDRGLRHRRAPTSAAPSSRRSAPCCRRSRCRTRSRRARRWRCSASFYRAATARRRAARAVRARPKGRRAVRHAVGRPAPAARARAGVRQQSGARLPRRADDRAGSAVAARAARGNRADEARRPYRAADDPLHRRGGAALRPDRDHRSRPDHRDRPAARADRADRRRCSPCRSRPRRRSTASGCRAIPGVEDLVCDGSTVTFRTATVSRTLAALMRVLDAARRRTRRTARAQGDAGGRVHRADGRRRPH